MMERYKKIWVALSIVSSVMLIYAFTERPSDYYQILRVVISVTAFFGVWLFYQLRNLEWVWIFAIIGLIFNPIAVLSLSMDTWKVIDIIAATVFVASLLAFQSVRTRLMTLFNIQKNTMNYEEELERLDNVVTDAIKNSSFDARLLSASISYLKMLKPAHIENKRKGTDNYKYYELHSIFLHYKGNNKAALDSINEAIESYGKDYPRANNLKKRIKNELFSYKDKNAFSRERTSNKAYIFLVVIGVFLQLLAVFTVGGALLTPIGFIFSAIGVTVLIVETIKNKWLKILAIPIVVISWIFISEIIVGYARQIITG